MHSHWNNRRSAAEYVSRRVIETMLVFWMGRDPERRSRFENRIRFESFDAAMQVMQLSEQEMRQLRDTFATRQKMAGFKSAECPTFEDAWQIGRRHWLREPLLAELGLLDALRPAIDAAARSLDAEGGDLRLETHPGMPRNFESIAQHLRQEDPSSPKLIDRFSHPTRIGWKILDEARFRLLTHPAYRLSARAA